MIRIQLNRLGCYGTCPSYTVTVFGNGYAVYESGEFVRVKGRQKTRISERAIDDLIRRVNDLQFFSVKLPKGSMCVTDGSTASVTASEPGRTRQINDECVDSKELQELEKAIDDAVEIQQWVFITHAELQRQIDRGWDITVHGLEYANQAIEWDDGNVLKVLVKNGVQVDSRDQDGSTLLMRAVLADKFTSAKALLEAGANPKLRSFDGWSPGPNAGNRSIRMCKLLLDYGVDINDQDGLGQTMLMNAAGTFPTHLDIVKFLIESGANPNVRDQNGETAIAIAKRMHQEFQQQIVWITDPAIPAPIARTAPPHLDQAVRDYDRIIDFLRQHGGAE